MNSPVIDAYLDALLDAGPVQDAVAEPMPAMSASASSDTAVVAVSACAAAVELPCAAMEVEAAAPPPRPAATSAPKPAPAVETLAARLPAPTQAPTQAPPCAPTPRALSNLVASPSPSSSATTHRWLRVNVGQDSYALELLRVQEVGRTAPIVAMRGASTAVLGAMNLRGRIVPVFDLGLWLGTGHVQPDERARIVVVERDNELIGALVSAVEDVVTLGPDGIEPPMIRSQSRAIVGVARVGSKPTVLLDANALFG
jgi:purine-binding chemotaxis protein CheW